MKAHKALKYNTILELDDSEVADLRNWLSLFKLLGEEKYNLTDFSTPNMSKITNFIDTLNKAK